MWALVKQTVTNPTLLTKLGDSLLTNKLPHVTMGLETARNGQQPETYTRRYKVKITVTEYTDDEETHKMVVEADKAVISRDVGECIQQRIDELGLVLDYCVYLSPEGKQVKFPLSLELTKNDEPPPEGCPTDEEIQIASWSEGRGYGDFPDAPIDGMTRGVDYD